MDNELKVYTPAVIQDTPFPIDPSVVDPGAMSQSTSKDVYSPAKIDPTEFPSPKFATELLAQALNTQSRKILQPFEFTKSGALQVGEYQAGVSGDIRITPNGVTARDSSGNTTFNLDGDSGNATFKGTVRASTLESSNLLTGLVDVGTGANNSYVRLDGANNRIVVHDGTNPRIVIGNV